jgi:hypothetical protein
MSSARCAEAGDAHTARQSAAASEPIFQELQELIFISKPFPE